MVEINGGYLAVAFNRLCCHASALPALLETIPPSLPITPTLPLAISSLLGNFRGNGKVMVSLFSAMVLPL